MKRNLLLLFSACLSVVAWCQRLTPEQTGGVYYAYPVHSSQFTVHSSQFTVHSSQFTVHSSQLSVDGSKAQPNCELCTSNYELFYISHYGRHGSRWLPDEARYVWVNEQFADNSNLTPLGRDVKRRLKKIWKNARGNAGQLTALGAAQHRGIARRMAERFPAVFAPGAHLQARSSVVPRCRASMLAFCDELKSIFNLQSSMFNIETNQRFMAYINHVSPEQKALEQRTKRQPMIDTDRFISSLFKDAMKVKEPKKLLSELHTIASDMQDIPLKVSLWDIFTYDEMMAVHDANNERMTINNGDTLLNAGIPACSSIALWQNIVEEADSIIAVGGHGASLRFGHDTALYRLLTLLGLSLPGKGMEQIIPMAANLQMVFARDKDGKVVVAFLHNERLQHLPLHDSDGFYEWQQVKDYMTDRIHRLEHLRQLSALNTMVGTAPANTRTAGLFGKGSEEHGQTLPAVLVPHGQTFWTPQTRATEKKCVAPYYYTDTLFQGIRASHWLVGGCTQDYGSFTVAANALQSLEASPTMLQSLEASPTMLQRLEALPTMLQRLEALPTMFTHADEESHPYYYKVYLPGERLRLELTGLSHAAALRVTPDDDQQVCITLKANSDEGQATAAVDTLRRLVFMQNPVHRIYQGWGESAGFSGHLALRYPDGLVAVSHTDSTATLVFNGHEGEPLTFFMATSFTSSDGALRNLDTEATTFDDMMQRNIDRWTARLHTIDIDDPDTARVNQFYGALYRASFLPREMSDVDGRYPAFSSQFTVHSSQLPAEENITQSNCELRTVNCELKKRYGDFSMWDTYRALHPLLCIIAPDETAQMMQSLVGMYEEGGWLPIFPCWNSYTAAMIGDHCTSVLADAWVKGIRGFDGKKAYEAMRKNALQQPATAEEYKNGMGRRALQSYMKYGFIPLEDPVAEAFHQQEQTSRTLEYAYDDFCVAQMAQALAQSSAVSAVPAVPAVSGVSEVPAVSAVPGVSEVSAVPDYSSDYRLFLSRSENWRNVINPVTGYADGRHADGRWEGNTDLVHRQPYITEGATCHYTWYVPHNIPSLIELMGGKEKFTEKLDSMFTEGRYWHGNEPCHQVPWLFTLAGHPEKTRQWVRHIVDTEYNDSPGGLSGNDDAGQMSAWFIFACLGFYPVCPGTPEYVTSTPLFRRITINPPGGQPMVFNADDELPPVITLTPHR